MQTSGKNTGKILTAAILVALLFDFGTPAHASVSARPSILNLGSQAIGTISAPVIVTLTNTNTRSVTISSDSV
jgi:hypothetical protein